MIYPDAKCSFLRTYRSPPTRPFRLAAQPVGLPRRRAKTISLPASLSPAKRELPLFVLGGGSNLLVSDAGFSGLVLRIALRGIASTRGERPFDRLRCGRRRLGWAWSPTPSPRDCAGFECLSGIPGTVGGTPVQNVGAYGQEVSQTIVTVRAFDRKAAKFVDLPASGCGFSYRRSIFNTTEREPLYRQPG